MNTTKYHLFLVDDDPEERYLMQLAFCDIGWEHSFRCFSSAEAMLRHLSFLPSHLYPSLLLLDYHMPGINGAELLAMLKRNPSFQHLPVAVYSSLMNDTLEQKLIGAGAIRCFAKARNNAGALALAINLRSLALTSINS